MTRPTYDLPPAPPTIIDGRPHPTHREYWPAVTDIPCPSTRCAGTIRWAEAGYVPGYRICDGCGRHFASGGTAIAPTLTLQRGSAIRYPRDVEPLAQPAPPPTNPEAHATDSPRTTRPHKRPPAPRRAALPQP